MIRRTENDSVEDRVNIRDNASSDRDLMAQALSIYSPDIGLAMLCALEVKFILHKSPESPVFGLACSDGPFTGLWNNDRSKVLKPGGKFMTTGFSSGFFSMTLSSLLSDEKIRQVRFWGWHSK